MPGKGKEGVLARQNKKGRNASASPAQTTTISDKRAGKADAKQPVAAKPAAAPAAGKAKS